MAKNSLPRSNENYTYVLRFNQDQWQDFKNLMITATCISSTFEEQEFCVDDYHQRMINNFNYLIKVFEDITFHKEIITNMEDHNRSFWLS